VGPWVMMTPCRLLWASFPRCSKALVQLYVLLPWRGTQNVWVIRKLRVACDRTIVRNLDLGVCYSMSFPKSLCSSFGHPAPGTPMDLTRAFLRTGRIVALRIAMHRCAGNIPLHTSPADSACRTPRQRLTPIGEEMPAQILLVCNGRKAFPPD
jgi:hypothetical protein